MENFDNFFEEYLEDKGENLRKKLEKERYLLISKGFIDKPLLLITSYPCLITVLFISTIFLLFPTNALVITSCFISIVSIIFLIDFIPRTNIEEDRLIVRGIFHITKRIIEWADIENVNIDVKQKTTFGGDPHIYYVYWLILTIKNQIKPIRIYLGRKKNWARFSLIKDFFKFMSLNAKISKLMEIYDEWSGEGEDKEI